VENVHVRVSRVNTLTSSNKAVEGPINLSTCEFGSGELGGNLARAEDRLPQNSRNGFTDYKASLKALPCTRPPTASLYY
jgi:hypothetical protein